MSNEIIEIKIDKGHIEGELVIPVSAKGLVLFAHGSGSSRFSPRNNYVAKILQKENIATLLIDLLTKSEDLNYEQRFDIKLLSERLIEVTDWLKENHDTKNLKVGYFGASTGSAAAINAAAIKKDEISAVVSRGGRVDLARDDALAKIEAPTLLLVGELDDFVIEVNELAYKKINCEKKLSIIPNASHLFEEPGTLEEVALQAANWFVKHFKES